MLFSKAITRASAGRFVLSGKNSISFQSIFITIRARHWFSKEELQHSKFIMTKKNLLLFLFFINQAFCQDKNNTNPEKAIVEVFEKCYKDLNPIEATINIIPEKKNVKFCSLYQCVSRVAYVEKEKDIENVIIKRAVEIAVRLYNDGTPVYLIYGMNSSSQADWDNQILTDDDNLIYVSIAECIVSHSLIKISEAVNKATMELINNSKSIKAKKIE
ncbi:hypothetical protein [Flavobacterium sp. WLB]|uniref:hypothetical protein n=2 Tax=Flavobacterium TaxID=237 RepID=UPI0013FD4AE8|nr:hypothetical protein [Flavobacterium sp. WLB]